MRRGGRKPCPTLVLQHASVCASLYLLCRVLSVARVSACPVWLVIRLTLPLVLFLAVSLKGTRNEQAREPQSGITFHTLPCSCRWCATDPFPPSCCRPVWPAERSKARSHEGRAAVLLTFAALEEEKATTQQEDKRRKRTSKEAEAVCCCSRVVLLTFR